MNEQHARELFIEHHRGSLAAVDEAELRAFLAAHPALQREFDEFAATLNALDAMPVPPPSSRLRANLLASIEREKDASRENLPASSLVSIPLPARSVQRFRWVWLARIGSACALLVAGYVAGTHHAAVAPKPVAEPATVGDPASQSEIAELRRQIEAVNQLVYQSVLQQPQRPTNDRLISVLASARLENPNAKVIDELIGSLVLDPSTNVRLTALEALYPHADQEVVRASVLSALPREQSPLVQVAIIDFLAAARDRAAAPALDRISRSDAADRNVRAAAMTALTRL